MEPLPFGPSVPLGGRLSASYVATRVALHQVACYVMAPALRAATGRIRLAALPGGFGTPAFGAGRRIHVVAGRDEVLLVVDEAGVPLAGATVRRLAEVVGIEVSPDPGVGADLPPFEPDAALSVDLAATRVVVTWLSFGEAVLGELWVRLAGAAPAAELVLWPEHFDLGFSVDVPGTRAANYGASLGDRECPEPYLYVSPWDRAGLDSPAWNASFGALLRWSELAGSPSPAAQAKAWFDDRLAALGQ